MIVTIHDMVNRRTVDRHNAAHVVVTFGAFSRRRIPGAGVGHVFVSHNGGGTWKNISGNLPDAPVNASVVWGHRLVVGTDVGVFATPAAAPGHWVRLGRSLPAAPAVDLDVSPDQGYLLVPTHGRGLWRLSP